MFYKIQKYVSIVLRITKNNFYKKKLNGVAYSPKLTWKLINDSRPCLKI